MPNRESPHEGIYTSLAGSGVDPRVSDDTYCLWVTLLTTAALDGLLLGLVHAGILVQALDDEGEMIENPDVVGKLVALQVAFAGEVDDDLGEDDLIQNLNDALSKVIEERSIKHLGYVIVDRQHDRIRWASGNVLASESLAPSAVSTPWGRLRQPPPSDSGR